MKIVQIATIPESEHRYASIVALTEDGRIFMNMRGPTDPPNKWFEIEPPKE